ncbi:MAG: deoxyribonuclease V [Myxococcota bacterium]|jgi:deoxyribonuclease V
MEPRFLAVDVQYDEAADTGWVAGLWFDRWTDPVPVRSDVRLHFGLQPYAPGEFYKRELPALLELVLESVDLGEVHTVIVDSYVDLGAEPGMGRHLWHALDRRVRVVGVAKTRFNSADPIEVIRGESTRPLYITATSDAQEAADGVASMHGAYRIPTLLKAVDALARGR